MSSPNSTSLRVNIHAPNSSLVKELITHLEAVNAKVAGNKTSKKNLFTDPDYVICAGIGRELNRGVGTARNFNSKLVVLLPLVFKREKDYKKTLKVINKIPKDIKCKIIWVGDNGEGFKANFDQGPANYFLISSLDAARVITRAMFSFWQVPSQGLKLEEFSVTDKIPAEALSGYTSPKAKSRVFQSEVRGRILTPGVDTVSRIFNKPVEEVSRAQKPKAKRHKLLALVILLVLIILTPLVLLMFSGVLGYFGYSNLTINPYQSQELFESAEKLAKLSSKLLPIKPALLMQETLEVGKSSAAVVVTTNQIKEGVFSDRKINLGDLSHKLKLDLDKVYADSAFLESEVGENNFFDRSIVSKAREVVPHLPFILGEGSPKSYLILIQNDSSVESLALITFQDGKIINTQEMSLESVNSQFKGQALPPNPTKMEEVTKAADFPEVARRSLWFLDKSIGVSVDGVVVVKGSERWEKLKKLDLEWSDLTNQNIQLYFIEPSIQAIFSKL